MSPRWTQPTPGRTPGVACLVVAATMTGVVLPGDRRVEFRSVPVPEPGHGQVLVAVRASTICGSDLRAIYREHLGHGPEAYAGVIAGHEPAGVVVAVGPGVRRFAPGDRVIVYHIAGCGLCPDCREGYFISCRSERRQAYGWQRDGGHAPFLLAEEATLVALPEPLSFVDGACVACGFGTAYEGLVRLEVSGRDHVLVVGLGPVGLAAGLLAKALGGAGVVGVDTVQERCDLALSLGAVDRAFAGAEPDPDAVRRALGPDGFDASVDCSGAEAGRGLALSSLRRFGRCVLLGEGGTLRLEASEVLIHPSLTVFGSWVTSVGHMEDLTQLLVRSGVRPERVVTHRFALKDADAAYRTADAGTAGKVAIVFEEDGVP